VTSLISVTAGLEMHLTEHENIHIKGSYIGLEYDQLVELEQEIIDFANTGEFIDMPVKKFAFGIVGTFSLRNSNLISNRNFAIRRMTYSWR